MFSLLAYFKLVICSVTAVYQNHMTLSSSVQTVLYPGLTFFVQPSFLLSYSRCLKTRGKVFLLFFFFFPPLQKIWIIHFSIAVIVTVKCCCCFFSAHTIIYLIQHCSSAYWRRGRSYGALFNGKCICGFSHNVWIHRKWLRAGGPWLSFTTNAENISNNTFRPK